MRFERFCRVVRRECAKLPKALLDGLEGGVHCERTARRDPDARDIYQLANYEPGCVLGPRVVLHHGSFEQMRFPDERTYRREIRITVRHELRHHWEDRAGLPDLRDEDAAWIAKHGKKRPRSVPCDHDHGAAHGRAGSTELSPASARWVVRVFGGFLVVAAAVLPLLVLPAPPLASACVGLITGTLAYRNLFPPKRRKKMKKRALLPPPRRRALPPPEDLGRFGRHRRRHAKRSPGTRARRPGAPPDSAPPDSTPP